MSDAGRRAAGTAGGRARYQLRRYCPKNAMRGWEKISESRYERGPWALTKSGRWSVIGPVANTTHQARAYLRNTGLTIRRFDSAELAARAVGVEIERRAKAAATQSAVLKGPKVSGDKDFNSWHIVSPGHWGGVAMPRAGLGLQSFDPQALSVLYAVFDDIVAEMDGELTVGNRHRVHEAIAKSLIDLGKAGQLDPRQLKRYALAQGRSEIVR